MSEAAETQSDETCPHCGANAKGALKYEEKYLGLVHDLRLVEKIARKKGGDLIDMATDLEKVTNADALFSALVQRLLNPPKLRVQFGLRQQGRFLTVARELVAGATQETKEKIGKLIGWTPDASVSYFVSTLQALIDDIKVARAPEADFFGDVEFHPVAWAELKADYYAGGENDPPKKRWETYAEGDKQSSTEEGDLSVSLGHHPFGTRVEICLPHCPNCHLDRETCELYQKEHGDDVDEGDCTFNWSEWDEGQYS